MTTALAIVCALALLVILLLVRQHGRTRRALTQAIVTRQPVRPKSLPGLSGRANAGLAAEINEIIEENARLHRLRSGQLAQLDATLGSVQESVLIIDRDNSILLANKALQQLFPRAGAALRQRFERVIHSAAFLEYVEAVRAGTARAQHEIAFTIGADTRWLEVTGATIPAADDTEGAWSLFVLHDITRQKKLEAVRKEFVANVSHELRTPLSIVKGCAETLVDGHRDMPADDRDRFLRIIHRHAERLATLLDDILTLSRLESGNHGLRPERVSLPRLINAVLEDYRARPAAADRKIVAEIDPAIGDLMLDPVKITQVFENLIDNALKYTPKESPVELTAKLRDAPGAAREVEVSLRDHGPGIPAADLPHIFERFYRVDKGRSRDTGGTGLGLSIVKHIVQLHGGRVAVASAPGEGATFTITLPAGS